MEKLHFFKKRTWLLPISLLIPLVPIFIYLFISLLLSLIPVGELHSANPPDRIPVYLSSNGVHVNFILPVMNPWFDWRLHISSKKHKIYFNETNFLSFGWGDRDFYLKTREFSDLTLSSAFSAMFLDSPSVMHVLVYKKEPIIKEWVKRIFVDKEQYLKLTSFILNSFANPDDITPVPCCPYYPGHDQFYPAKGSYDLFFTCNTWIVEGMQKIGAKTALWSPYPLGIFYHIP
ncbi:MAG: TIGR02117 family protein [Oligoflexales bacterium]